VSSSRWAGGVAGLWLGKRVVAHLGFAPGGYAELAVTEVDRVHEIPANLDFAEAVAMIGTGRTAMGILQFAELGPDAVAVIPAAAGGIGTLLVQYAKNAGATVVGLAGGPEKTARVAANVLVSRYHIVSLPRFEGDVRFVDTMPHATADTHAAPAPPAVPRPVELTSVPQAPRVRPDSPRRPAAAATGVSSTGLSPEIAGALAYLAGPFSGALLLIVERTSRSVRFHAWQALIGLGLLGLAALTFLGLAFFLLLFSPRGFAVMRWAAAGTALAWLLLWAWCLLRAYRGQEWQMPIIGAHARRWA